MASILRDSDCPVLAAFRKQSKSNLTEWAKAVHISCPEKLQRLLEAKHDIRGPLAELIYVEEAHRLAESGDVDQVNQMTDLQLKLVAHSKGMFTQEQLNDQTPIKLRILLLALNRRPSPNPDGFEERLQTPDSEDNDNEGEKVILTRNNGVTMRF